MHVLISTTATQTGYGTDPHKRVTGLTATERAHARAGGVVLYNCGRPANGKRGTTWRRAIPGGNRTFYPRVPSPEQIEAAQLDAIAHCP